MHRTAGRSEFSLSRPRYERAVEGDARSARRIKQLLAPLYEGSARGEVVRRRSLVPSTAHRFTNFYLKTAPKVVRWVAPIRCLGSGVYNRNTRRRERGTRGETPLPNPLHPTRSRSAAIHKLSEGASTASEHRSQGLLLLDIGCAYSEAAREMGISVSRSQG
jgi:hypothetical protein